MAYEKDDIDVAILDIPDWDDDDNNLRGKLVAKLPHSCDQWIIGGKEEVETMIEDLKVALDKLKQV